MSQIPTQGPPPQITSVVGGERVLTVRNNNKGCLITGGFFALICILPGVVAFAYQRNREVIPFVIVGTIVVITIVFRHGEPSFLGQGFFRGVAKRIFKSREEAVVDPDHPDALFVQVIPKSNWGRHVGEPASDVGFLIPDTANRRLLFEGDLERWVFPAESIVSCVIDRYAVDKQGLNATNIVVLTVATTRGPVDYPLMPRSRGKKQLTSHNKDMRSLELYTLITAAIETSALTPIVPIDVGTAPQRVPNAFAQFTSVEPPGQLLSKSVIYTVGIFEIAQAVWLFAAIPLAIFIGIKNWGIGYIAFISVLWIVNFYFLVVSGSSISNRFFHARLRRVISQRAGAILRPDDTGVVLVDIVPREHWGKIKLENASDTGLLLVDAVNGQVLFEGDQERWILPHGSIISCVLEQKEQGKLFAVLLLTVHTPDGPRELPLVSRASDKAVLQQSDRDARTAGLFELLKPLAGM